MYLTPDCGELIFSVMVASVQAGRTILADGAVGTVFTVIVALPVCACEHWVLLASLTLTRL